MTNSGIRESYFRVHIPKFSDTSVVGKGTNLNFVRVRQFESHWSKFGRKNNSCDLSHLKYKNITTHILKEGKVLFNDTFNYGYMASHI